MARAGGSYRRDPKTGKTKLVERTQNGEQGSEVRGQGAPTPGPQSPIPQKRTAKGLPDRQTGDKE